MIRSSLRRVFGSTLKRYRSVWRGLIEADTKIERARHTAARVLPVVIRPEPRHLEIAITAHCNLRCVGCRYGRDFMPGQQLPLILVKQLLDDAHAIGFWDVRFYGGEPLIHPDLTPMVAHAINLGLQTHITTNGMLLARRIDELYAVGLRNITIGYYGTGAKYDAYVQRKARFAELEAGVAEVRQRYGESVDLRINWLLMRPSCNLEDLHAAWNFAQRYKMRMQVDLIHYSLPYFSEGPDRMLQFRPEDEDAIHTVTEELLRLKATAPNMLNISHEGIRSVPDWLLQGPGMRVPCDAYQMIWVGADGTVQLCYVTHRLGNLHDTRLKDLLFRSAHRQAARDAFSLNCPNCHCHYDRRVRKDSVSRAHYGGGS